MRRLLRRLPTSQLDMGGKAAAPAAEGVDVGEDSPAQGEAIGLGVLVEELVFELGHVDTGGALGLATLAFYAQVHGFVEALAGEGLLGQGPGEDRSEEVGAAPGGMLLLMGDHVRRAHHPLGLAAGAHSVALLNGAGEIGVSGEVEGCDGAGGLGRPCRSGDSRSSGGCR